MAIATMPDGRTVVNAIGMRAAMLPAIKTSRWRSPKIVLDQNTGEALTRAKCTEAAIAPKVSSPSRTTNSGATDRYQFSMDQSRAKIQARGANIRKTAPGLGSAAEEAKPAKIAAPRKAITQANPSETRRRFKARS